MYRRDSIIECSKVAIAKFNEDSFSSKRKPDSKI